LTPEAVLAASPPALRACGLSERKASYLQDLAAHFQDGRLSDDLLTSKLTST
jgi:DNA-3-methyladenine glycosylase II